MFTDATQSKLLQQAGYAALQLNQDGQILAADAVAVDLLGTAIGQNYFMLYQESEQLRAQFTALKDTARLEHHRLNLNDRSLLVEQIVSRQADGYALLLRPLSEPGPHLHLLENAIYWANDAIVITTAGLEYPDPRIIFVNPAFCQMTGYQERELIGQTPRLLQGPKTSRETMTRLRERLAQGEPFSAEAINYRKDGSEYYVQWNIFPIHDANGSITHFLSLQRDVSHFKQALQALQATEHRLNKLLDVAPATLFSIDSQGVIISCEGEKLLNLHDSAENLIGRRAYDVLMPYPQVLNDLNQALQGVEIQNTVYVERGVYDFTYSPIRAENGMITGVLGTCVDITQREQVDEDFRQHEELYRTLARSLPNTSVLLFNRELRYLIAEGTSLERQGYSRRAMEGKTLSEVVTRQNAQYLEPFYQAALRGQSALFERQLGRAIYQTHILPVKNEHGEIFAGLDVSQDITEYKRAESALRQSERRNRALLRTIPDQIFVMNKNGTYIEFESQETRSSLMASEPIAGLNIRDTGQPEYIVRQTFNALEMAIATGHTQTFTYDLAQGEIIQSYEARFVALTGDEVMVIVRDMTDLRQAQAQLRQRVQELTLLSEVEAELAQVLDIDYVLTMALDSTVRLSGATGGFIVLLGDQRAIEKSRYVGQYQDDLIADALRSAKSPIGRVYRSGRGELIHEGCKRKDDPCIAGTTAQIILPLISHNKVIGLLKLDTHRYNAFNNQSFDFVKLIAGRIAVAIVNARLYRQTVSQLDELRGLYDKVSRLEQLKTDMIRIAAHDLRAPLMVILSYSGMIKTALQDNDPQSAHGYLDEVGSASQRMRKIITDILSLERIEEIAKGANFTVFDLREVILQAYQDQRGQAQLKHQLYVLDCPEEAVWIEGDALQLKEAIANLISNALKYTPERGTIHVSLKRQADQVAFRVIDNGYGIKEAQQARLFQPFYRAKSPETQKIEGSGLGLHLVKNIIDRHHGALVFVSQYGQGSTFGFDLRGVSPA
ncbi:MAG: PAS domain-containing protein [Anaerolineae bacterium]|nr:PAS domain-containing protein [Anaerolineae bacterium]